jgi:hypothetical protein
MGCGDESKTVEAEDVARVHLRIRSRCQKLGGLERHMTRDGEMRLTFYMPDRQTVNFNSLALALFCYESNDLAHGSWSHVPSSTVRWVF